MFELINLLTLKPENEQEGLGSKKSVGEMVEENHRSSQSKSSSIFNLHRFKELVDKSPEVVLNRIISVSDTGDSKFPKDITQDFLFSLPINFSQNEVSSFPIRVILGQIKSCHNF